MNWIYSVNFQIQIFPNETFMQKGSKLKWISADLVIEDSQPWKWETKGVVGRYQETWRTLILPPLCSHSYTGFHLQIIHSCLCLSHRTLRVRVKQSQEQKLLKMTQAKKKKKDQTTKTTCTKNINPHSSVVGTNDAFVVVFLSFYYHTIIWNGFIVF